MAIVVVSNLKGFQKEIKNNFYAKDNKYNAIRQTYNGRSYHSLFEAKYAFELDLRVKAKDIKSWEPQIIIPLDVDNEHICNYIVDFKVIHNDGSIELIEVKGFVTDIFKLKEKLLRATYLKENPLIKYTIIY